MFYLEHFNILYRLYPKSLMDVCGQIQLIRDCESSTDAVMTQIISPDKINK